jgi:hypothetical protein
MASKRIKLVNQEAFVEELSDIGYTEKEIKQFQETIRCPRCGCDFSNLPLDGRWFSHLANCKGKQPK